jgi:hypothetical protein
LTRRGSARILATVNARATSTRALPVPDAGGARTAAAHGHCVVCGTEGTGPLDFICSDCGDPLGITLYCLACGRRLALDPGTADAFLRDSGYALDDLTGVVLKVTRCGRCMDGTGTADMSVYRLRIGR